jgi:Fe2+ or Zn2+ uptake regulation protein
METKKSTSLKGHENHAIDCNGREFQDLAVEALQNANFRITKPRIAVIECLAHSKAPLSPKSIYEKVIHSGEFKIDQVSVYRILETLAQLNLIHQVFPSGDYLPCTTRCEQNPNHIILNCTKCEKVTEIHLDWNYIHNIFENVNNKFKFTPAKQMFQIDGNCEKCR